MERIKVKRIILITLLSLGAIVISGLSGSIAGSVVAERTLELQSAAQKSIVIGQRSVTSTRQGTAIATTTGIRLVPLSAVVSSLQLVPDSVLARKSPVAILYARKKVTTDLLRQDAELGRAVAVTSDGWFVTTATALQDVHMADVQIWYDRQVYKIDKAVLDRATQVVFLKTAASNLPAPAFAATTGKRDGFSVWLETSPGEFFQSAVSAYRPSEPSAWLSSDRVESRLLANGSLNTNELGSPLWDPNGALVGLSDSAQNGRVQALSALGISSSLQSLVTDGQIKHAALGVLSLDRTLALLVVDDKSMPTRGAWLKDDKKTVTIVRGSAAEKAGLKPGDVILQVDRDILDGSLDLGDLVMQYRSGTSLNLRVWRNGQEIDLPVTFGTQITSQILP